MLKAHFNKQKKKAQLRSLFMWPFMAAHKLPAVKCKLFNEPFQIKFENSSI